MIRRRRLRGRAAIRQGITLGKLAAKIYEPDSAERYSWILPKLMRETFLRTYWGSRRRAGAGEFDAIVLGHWKQETSPDDGRPLMDRIDEHLV